MVIALIIAICIVVGLVAFGRIPEKYYPYLLYGIGVSLLWSVSLQSSYLIGTDIHLEYYYVHLAQTQGWDSSLPCTYNGSLPLVIIAPFLANLFHIDAIWILKAAFPMLFAVVPVMLYWLFKSQFNPKDSFLAVFFLISMPAFFLELSGLARQEAAEMAFVLCLYAVVCRRSIPLAIGAAVLTVVAHYTMGILLMVYMVGGLIVVGIIRAAEKREYKLIIVTSIVIAVVTFLYYSRVCSGILMHVLAFQLGEVVPVNFSFLTCLSPNVAAGPVLPIAQGQETLVRTALGLDFLAASGLGKLFRILQYATQAAIAVGFGYMVLRWKRLNINPIFLGFVCVSVLLLGLCIVVPGFTSLINTSRLYHIALLTLAPAAILGGKLVFRNVKVLALCLLIPYFLFTSGLVFEAANCEETLKMDIPYSVALSNHRIDLGGSLEHDDEVVRDWIVGNDKFPVYADWYGLLFLHERCGIGIDKISQLPADLEVPEGSYIFVRTRNHRDDSVVLWTGVGLRERYEIDTEDWPPCFTSGDAGVYR